MLNPLRQVPAYWVACRCGTRIPLPHQSPLGTFEDREYLPTDKWPAYFLCLSCGQGFSCLAPRSGTMQALFLENSCLVEMPYLYGLGNSEVRKVLYIGVQSSPIQPGALQDARDFLRLSFGAETGTPRAYPWLPLA